MSRFLDAGSFFPVSKRDMTQRNPLFYMGIPIPSDLLGLKERNKIDKTLFSLHLFQHTAKAG